MRLCLPIIFVTCETFYSRSGRFISRRTVCRWGSGFCISCSSLLFSLSSLCSSLGGLSVGFINLFLCFNRSIGSCFSRLGGILFLLLDLAFFFFDHLLLFFKLGLCSRHSFLRLFLGLFNILFLLGFLLFGLCSFFRLLLNFLLQIFLHFLVRIWRLHCFQYVTRFTLNRILNFFDQVRVGIATGFNISLTSRSIDCNFNTGAGIRSGGKLRLSWLFRITFELS